MLTGCEVTIRQLGRSHHRMSPKQWLDGIQFETSDTQRLINITTRISRRNYLLTGCEVTWRWIRRSHHQICPMQWLDGIHAETSDTQRLINRNHSHK